MSTDEFLKRATKSVKKREKELEHPIEDEYVSYALSRGCRPKKLVELGKRHFLDRTTFCPGGRILIIEFKRPGKDATSKQQERIDELQKLGFQVHVCDRRGQAESLLDELLDDL